MGWNGLSLRNEFAAQLSDTSTSFKSKVDGWINEIQDDICKRHQWPFLKKTGECTLTASEELQRIDLVEPTGLSGVLAAGGSLTEDSSYIAKVSYYRSSDALESKPSNVTSTLVATAVNKTITLTLPTSSDTSVTARVVYLSKDGGDYYYVGVVSDNTTTTYNITADTSSLRQPLDYIPIRSLYGSPYLVDQNRGQLEYRTEEDLRMLFFGEFETGVPFYWADRGQNYIILQPKPASAYTLKFTYLKIPVRVYASADSLLDLPITLKSALKAGVLWKGYEYRERSDTMNQFSVYEKLVEQAISDSTVNFVSGRVRDVTGSLDGFVV